MASPTAATILDWIQILGQPTRDQLLDRLPGADEVDEEHISMLLQRLVDQGAVYLSGDHYWLQTTQKDVVLQYYSDGCPECDHELTENDIISEGLCPECGVYLAYEEAWQAWCQQVGEGVV